MPHSHSHSRLSTHSTRPAPVPACFSFVSFFSHDPVLCDRTLEQHTALSAEKCESHCLAPPCPLHVSPASPSPTTTRQLRRTSAPACSTRKQQHEPKLDPKQTSHHRDQRRRPLQLVGTESHRKSRAGDPADVQLSARRAGCSRHGKLPLLLPFWCTPSSPSSPLFNRYLN